MDILARDGVMSTIYKGVSTQLNIARTVAQWLSENLPIDRTTDQLIGPVIIAFTLFTAFLLYLSLGLGSSESPSSAPNPSQEAAEKKAQ